MRISVGFWIGNSPNCWNLSRQVVAGIRSNGVWQGFGDVLGMLNSKGMSFEDCERWNYWPEVD